MAGTTALLRWRTTDKFSSGRLHAALNPKGPTRGAGGVASRPGGRLKDQCRRAGTGGERLISAMKPTSSTIRCRNDRSDAELRDQVGAATAEDG